MNAAAVQSRKPVQQDLRYYLPRWMLVFVVITVIQELAISPSEPPGRWTVPNLVLIGLLEGTVGGLVFVGLQRRWNPKNSRVVRIRNSVAACIIVAVGSLWVNSAISS